MKSDLDWTKLHARLHQTLLQRQLLPDRQRILVAVSGGQDSLCLGKLLLDLRSKWFWEIAIAHCDHLWRSDVGIADRVKQVTQSWQVDFYLKTAATAIPETEAAAREWRYQALIEIAGAEKFDYIVTGHTLSDRAETTIYNLVRGSGSDGLQSLSWQRYLTDKIQLVRPLLNFSRTETGLFCEQFNLPVWEDAVNQNLKYARNRIRTELIPYLQNHFNPQVETHLAQTAEILQAEVKFLEDSAQKILQSLLANDGNALNRQQLTNIPLALQRRVIRLFLREKFAKQPTFEQIEAVYALIDAPNRSRTSSLTQGAIVEVQGQYLVFKPGLQ